MKVAVLIPCFNEQATISKVVSDFKKLLPESHIYVCDNNSTDATAENARNAGATVLFEGKQGKGSAVRRMFADIDSDVYLMVDGDDTYDANDAENLIKTLINGQYDLVNGKRIESHVDNYRHGHRFGNWLLTSLVGAIFGRSFSDMLSGYKVFSRRYVKSFPAMSTGFEIETELTIHALEMEMATNEVPTKYGNRPVGSNSKLNTYRDGFRILTTIINLMKNEKPFFFYSIISGALLFFGLYLFVPVLLDFMRTGLVLKLPTVVVSVGLFIAALMGFFLAIVQHSIAHSRREFKRLHYLSIPHMSGWN
jgi:glycosyltransferase involved in cell wall biosynthesis